MCGENNYGAKDFVRDLLAGRTPTVTVENMGWVRAELRKQGLMHQTILQGSYGRPTYFAGWRLNGLRFRINHGQFITTEKWVSGHAHTAHVKEEGE